jgi:hypothetical protein
VAAEEASTPADLSLPRTDASNWESFFGHDRRLEMLFDYLTAGRPAWWRREAFHKVEFTEIEPKWHVFASRTRSSDTKTPWVFTWHALCGYSSERSDMLGAHQWKITTPRVSTRCQNCERQLDAIKAAAGARLAAEREARKNA